MNTSMRKYSLLLFSLLASAASFAQTDPTTPQVTRPLPSASALISFAEIPVNTYTGVPDIAVPIYNFPTHSKDINAAISLNYHPAGISLMEQASDVGNGWNLMAGGSINRTVINEPDEFYKTHPTDWQGNTLIPFFDDIYSFNFMGYNGRFRIVRSGETFSIQRMDNTPLKIEVNVNTTNFEATSFTIYDDKGYKYVFDVVDGNYSKFWVARWSQFVPGNRTIPYLSSYHLTKVYDNAGQVLINCNYTVLERTDPTNPLWTAYALKLSSIEAKDYGTAEFNYFFEGWGSKGSDPAELTSIEIKDIYGNRIKKYVFDYFYRELANSTRRFLEGIKEYDKTLTTYKNYGFDYKLDNANPYCEEEYQLGTDQYGYINLRPKIVPPRGPVYFMDLVDLTSPEMCTMGSLKKMTLPTGGKVEYEFESNTVADVDSPYYDLLNIHTAHEINRENYTTSVYDSTTYAINSLGTNTSWQFTVTGTTAKRLFFKFTGTAYTSDLYEPVTELLYPGYSISGPNGFHAGFGEGRIEADSYYACLGNMLDLEPGVYTITVHKIQGAINSSYPNPNGGTSGTITISENTLNSPLKEWLYEGGVRIKKITHYESITAETPAREINYDYQDFEHANRSSGQLYEGYWTQYETDKFIDTQVGYANVKVYDSGNKGYTKYYYKHYDAATVSAGYDYMLYYLAYKEGLLEKKEVYDNAGQLLTSNENTFDIEDTGELFPTNSTIDSYFLPTKLAWAKLANSVTKNYFYDAVNGQTVVENTDSYTYHTLNKRVDEHDASGGNGDTLKTKYYYHTGDSTVSKNRISELEKVETYRNGNLLTTSHITYYDEWGQVAKWFLPQTIETSKSSASLENRVRYTLYDKYSNPLELKQENGTTICYIWGYHSTQPIAKIENAAYASIDGSLIDAAITASDTSQTGTETNLDNALKALRNSLHNSLPNAMMTSYTYVPLVGLSVVTDPKNNKTTYSYDEFNRLKWVKDNENKLLSENSYYYRASISQQNYITSKIYKVPTSSSIATPDASEASQSITYYDGLGRTIQQIAKGQSGNGKDIISHIEYEDYTGRQPKNYLPYASDQNTMAYMDGATLKQNILDQYATLYGDANPYSEKALEASPLGRVLKQAAPGDDWAMGNLHEVKFDYQANVQDDGVYKLQATTGWDYDNGSYTITFNNYGSCPIGQLYKNITRNENWKATQSEPLLNTTEEFKDKEGHTVLKRNYSLANNQLQQHDTYYVYDEYGNLTYVLPPLAIVDNGIGQGVLDNLCYQYKYDYRNRLVAKKLPGKQWEFIAYNNQDKPIATGPALNPWGDPNSKGWLITKYDALGRIAYTGWKEAGTVDEPSRLALEVALGTAWAEHFTSSATTIDGVDMSYSNDTEPTDFNLLTVNYYDNYDYVRAPDDLPSEVLGQTVAGDVKGLATGSWVRVLTNANQALGESSYVLYDGKGRPIETNKTNYLGGYTITDGQLDFTGKTTYSYTYHKRKPSNEETKVKDMYTYTDQDRLWMHKQKINELPEQLISENEYDKLGQLVTKQVGGTDVTTYVGLQKVDYQYNIRGWLTNINDVGELQKTGVPKDLFAFKINYNTVENTVDDEVSKLYNGNIAETFWRSSSDNVLRKYGYTYDNLNRLNKAIYQKPDNTVPVTHMYDEEVGYDLNGNITGLKRNGDLDDPTATSALQIDNLTYTYDPDKKNQLMDVSDSGFVNKGFVDATGLITAQDYSYDDNGNLVSDKNKHITEIRYNNLNLPTLISFEDGNKISYLYNAAGQKVRKILSPPDEGTKVQTDYFDGFQYTDTVLNFFPHSEGYVNVTYCSTCEEPHYLFDYVFNYLDHLGNVRVSYGYDSTSQTVKILEENHYYAFGLKHTHYNVDKKEYKLEEDNTKIDQTGGALLYKYKYNGKEWQDEVGLNVYDYGARNYDPAIGRWMNIDPLAEVSRRYSPYAYVGDNPVKFIDPDGMRMMDAGDYNWDTGTYRSGSFEKAMKNAGELLFSDNIHSDMDNDIGADADGNSFTASSNVLEDSTSTGFKSDPPNKYQQWFSNRLKELNSIWNYSEPILRTAFDTLEVYGGTAEGVGLLAAVPSDGLSLPLAEVGAQYSLYGTLGNSALDFIEGKFEEGTIRLGKYVTSAGMGKAFEKIPFKTMGNMLNGYKAFLETYIMPVLEDSWNKFVAPQTVKL